jgi:tetratricopeptide (TPR) repeat protein
LPVTVRLGRRADDDCTACHMPRGITTNNAHLATTDHRIPRDAGSSARSTAKAGGLASFVNFHAGLMDRREREAAERDRGVAFCRDGPEGAAMALPRLEAALSRDPEDAIGWVSKAAALHVLGRDREAFAAYQEAIRRDPTREGTVEEAADVAARSGRREEALALWRRAITINPWRPHYYAELARAAARLGDWRLATEACGEALRLEPFDIETRKRLVQGLLRTSRMTAAQEEFERLLRSEPSERDALLRWYAAQVPHQ